MKHGGACARLEQARAQLSDQEMQRFAESVATQERSAAAATAGSDDMAASSAMVSVMCHPSSMPGAAIGLTLVRGRRESSL